MSAKQSTYKLSRSVKIETKETHLEDAGVERRRGWRMGAALGCRFRQRQAGGRGGAWQRWAGGRGSVGERRTGGGGHRTADRERICDGDLGRRGDLSVWVWERCGDSTAGWQAARTQPLSPYLADLHHATCTRLKSVSKIKLHFLQT
jgi:hypothetical protein